jgi:hypothetical protein
VRALLAVALLGAAMGGCGSSAGSAAPTGSEAAATDPPAQASATASAPAPGPSEPAPTVPPEASEPAETPAGGDGGGGSNGISAVTVEGQLSRGTASVDVTGDVTFSVEATGTGFSTGGFASMVYIGEGGASIQLAISAEAGSAGVAVTRGALATGGSFGTDCDITLSRNDGTGIAGDFSCADLPAIEGAVSKTVSLTGQFVMEK